MERKGFLLLLLLVLSLGCFANGKKETNGTIAEKEVVGESANKPVTLVVSITAANTEENYTGHSLQVFKDTVEKNSNGNVKLDCYWSNALFSQDAETAACIAGDCDMIYSGASWLTDGSPWVSMFTSGYFFKSVGHLNSVMNGSIGKEVYERIAKEQGILPLGAIYTGSRDISLSIDKAIKTPSDLKGIKLRMPNSESWMFLGKALGANPTPVNYSDLYLALKTGTVDGQDNPVTAMQAAKFYEVQKSITITNHVIDSIWPTVNVKKWNSLTKQQQQWIMEGFEAARDYCEKANTESVDSAIDFCKRNGLKVYYADIDAFSKHVQDYYLQSKYSEMWDMDLYKRIQDSAK